jgi:hypothetical protein
VKFRLFKTPKHRVFDYSPLYYNKKKERIEKLKREKERLKNRTDQEIIDESIIKNNLKDSWQKERKSQNKSSKIRYAVILTVLFTIAYLILTKVGGVLSSLSEFLDSLN